MNMKSRQDHHFGVAQDEVRFSRMNLLGFSHKCLTQFLTMASHIRIGVE